jgi:broad specificity phosphatase PhoE
MLDNNEFYLTLVRHGQSTTNANPDLMGQEPDVKLTAKGKKQANLLGHRLFLEHEKIDLAFSSPYTRAYDTAEIVTDYQQKLYGVPEGDFPIILAPELREYDAGDWTNANRHETLTLEIRTKMAQLAHAFLPPGGESMHQVERRSSLWLEKNILYNAEIQRQAAELKKDKKILNIYCFSHGMTIKCLLHYVMGFDQSFTWKLDIENTSMSKLYFGPNGWRLLGINDYAHLATLQD